MDITDCRQISENGNWAVEAQWLLNGLKPSSAKSNQFAIYWIEAGHKIREQLSDDRILVALLRHMLPPYQGDDMKLFRGENFDRWTSKNIGLAWTSEPEIAEMFARGLNSVHSGGILLGGKFNRESIISGPNSHIRKYALYQ